MRALLGPDHAGNRLEQGGFTGAVGPDQAEEFTRLDLEADPFQGAYTAEMHRDIPYFKQRGHGAGPPAGDARICTTGRYRPGRRAQSASPQRVGRRRAAACNR